MEEDYPRSLREFEACFAAEAACLDYLAKIRWPAGPRDNLSDLRHVPADLEQTDAPVAALSYSPPLLTV